MLKRCSNFFLVVAVSLLINVTLFLMIPFLSHIKETRQELDFVVNPTFVTKHKVEPRPKTPKPPEPDKPEPKPKTVPKKVIKQRPIKRSQPKVRFDMPEFDFQLSKIETQSVPIQAPPQRTAPTQPVQPSKSVYQLGEVDQEPRLIHRVRPIYPYYARRRDISGRVILKFLVDTKGNVTDISVVEAKPKGIFEESAIAAVKKWSFKPGSYEGKAVKTLVTVPITFELSQ